MADQFIKQELTLQNRHKEQVKLWLEPWGDLVSLAPGEELVIVAMGPPPGRLQLALLSYEYAVHAWRGSQVFIEKPVDEVIWRCPLPSP